MENLTLIIVALVFMYIFYGSKPKEKKDDKKGGDKKSKK
jgi:hypothetical protein